MKVRLFGVALRTGKGITMDEFFLHLETMNGKAFGNQILTVAKQDQFWTGLLITVKDWKAFCQFKRTGGDKFTISAKELEEGTNMAEFNFFVVYGPTGRGLYQYYHLSTHFSSYCVFLKKRYDELKQSKIQAEIDASEDKTIRYQRTIKAKYAGSFTFTALVRKGTLLERIEKWSCVMSLEFQYETLEYDHDQLAPLSRVAKTRWERFTFEKSNFAGVKSGIKTFIAQKLFKSLRVVGIDPDGVEQVYKLLNDYDTFGEFEYDDVIKTVSIDSNDPLGSVQKSEIVTNMLKVANGNAANSILTAPAMA